MLTRARDGSQRERERERYDCVRIKRLSPFYLRFGETSRRDASFPRDSDSGVMPLEFRASERENSLNVCVREVCPLFLGMITP